MGTVFPVRSMAEQLPDCWGGMTARLIVLAPRDLYMATDGRLARLWLFRLYVHAGLLTEI